jgi:hypothetical protein
VSDQFDDERLRALYREGAGDSAGAPHATPEALAAAAEHRGAEVDRVRTLDHVMTCAQCRREFDLLWATERAGQRLVARRRSLTTWSLLAAAAVVVIAVGVTVGLPGMRRGTPAAGAAGGVDAADSTERGAEGGGATGGASTIEVIAPRGPVAADAQRVFVWHAVPGDARYDLEVLDDTGRVVFRTATADTTIAWPELGVGRTYRWWVRANTVDAWRSPLTPFTTPSG